MSYQKNVLKNTRLKQYCLYCTAQWRTQRFSIGRGRDGGGLEAKCRRQTSLGAELPALG